MTIRHLPDTPNPYDRNTFDEKAWTFLTELDPWGQEVDGVGQQVAADKEDVLTLKQETQDIKDAAVNETQAIKEDIEQISENVGNTVEACQAAVVDCQAEVQNCQAEVQRAKDYIDSLLINPGTSTSTTSLVLTTGPKSFMIEPNKPFIPGMWVALIDFTNPRRWLKGYVTNYDSSNGGMSISVVRLNGVGTYSNWLVAQTTPDVARDYSPVSVKGIYIATSF